MSGPGLNLPKDDPRYHALSMVRAPAFLLLCVGTLNLLLCFVALVLAGLTASGMKVVPERWIVGLKEYTPLAFGLSAMAAVLCGVLSVWGALSALNLRGWGLAMVGSITASFCLSPTFCPGGMVATCWMLFILSRPDVRKAFTQ
jgi:hypothetical protein